MNEVPGQRIRRVNSAPVAEQGRFVLYWMIAARRTTWNFALQRAREWAERLDRPLVVLEALRIGYPWASERLHRFILDGMADNAAACADLPVTYYPYVEPEPDQDKGLLRALGCEACVVVTDEFPCFMLPRLVTAAAQQVPVLLETVDGNGLLPLRATGDRVFTTAHSYRRFLQKELPGHLREMPLAEPLRDFQPARPAEIPPAILQRWPTAAGELLAGGPEQLTGWPLAHAVPAVGQRGGPRAAADRLGLFLTRNLQRYVEKRTDLMDRATSGLSPYLHFGHVSPHEVFSRLTAQEGWAADRLFPKATGARQGWWNLSPESEAFLDQLVTWRELGFNMCFLEPGYDQFDSLPAWAQATLAAHADDPRPHRYDLARFEAARTHDRLWNAAQRELVREGTIHNYLRMLWGKKILEWSEDPLAALDIMIELNNKYALDGRDPNSYSGIFWTLGRYDRAWGPERPIFGKIRYMSSENTARKLKIKDYLERYGA